MKGVLTTGLETLIRAKLRVEEWASNRDNNNTYGPVASRWWTCKWVGNNYMPSCEPRGGLATGKATTPIDPVASRGMDLQVGQHILWAQLRLKEDLQLGEEQSTGLVVSRG